VRIVLARPEALVPRAREQDRDYLKLPPAPVTAYTAGMDWSAALQMAYLVIVCTVFPFFIQMWAVRKTSLTRVSLLQGTEPVWAAVIGVTLAGDALGPVGIFGVVLVLAGTMWGQRLELMAPPATPTATHEPDALRRHKRLDGTAVTSRSRWPGQQAHPSFEPVRNVPSLYPVWTAESASYGRSGSFNERI
jgi:hypothetical protein